MRKISVLQYFMKHENMLQNASKHYCWLTGLDIEWYSRKCGVASIKTWKPSWRCQTRAT